MDGVQSRFPPQNLGSRVAFSISLEQHAMVIFLQETRLRIDFQPTHFHFSILFTVPTIPREKLLLALKFALIIQH